MKKSSTLFKYILLYLVITSLVAYFILEPALITGLSLVVGALLSSAVITLVIFGIMKNGSREANPKHIAVDGQRYKTMPTEEETFNQLLTEPEYSHVPGNIYNHEDITKY